ncbi:zinc-dependent metalloprotease [Aureibacter tunicatorum]|uniref:T9SS type A sorting domain-containing protein n=1 Tax=Aureibacter tunicatorum TaxID=866807 RepID=A0AAE3XS92_9BACT|nr:zinc-dependent metalloprotease [Aureibacter tunicatorum]MDR6240559.1 hypothetical protein [Aureibacter tunicatorum]BDD06580.1 hypothetical protein AUTU_40630 [Aureibacter tunicatorum]
MKSKLLSLLAAGLLSTGISMAQEDNHPHLDCREPQLTQEQIEANIEYHENFRKEVESGQRRIKASTYRIPVVVHVYGSTFNHNKLDRKLIVDALAEASKDFQGLNDDFNEIDPLFNGRKATIDISFELAKYDENGNPTSGVVFYPVKEGYGGTWSDDEIRQDSWDNYKYMNIYIQNDMYADGFMFASGVAWYPGTAGNGNIGIERVVYNGSYLGANTDKEFASVFTHEFGHWLDLRHTFNGGCVGQNSTTQGDLVADTPPTTGSLGCRDALNCFNEPTNGENYMDYNVDCYKMFTQGQVNRMLAALNHNYRRTLWTDQNVQETLEKNVKSVAFERNFVQENYSSNDGTLAYENFTIELHNAEFASVGSILEEGVDYTISNLPEGYVSTLSVNSNNAAVLNISGQAKNHANANDVDVQITLNSNVFANSGDQVLGKTHTMRIDFEDPFDILYRTDIYLGDNETQAEGLVQKTTGNTFRKWFFHPQMDVGPNRDQDNPNWGHGVWWNGNGNAFMLETYGAGAISDEEFNVLVLEDGDYIGPNSVWNYPEDTDLYYLYDRLHTVWAGQTGYVGFRVRINRFVHFGWAKLKVDASGNTVEILDFAINNIPNAPIGAGETDIVAQDQTITFDDVQSPLDVNSDNFDLNAESTSGLQVIFTSSDPDVLKIINGNEVVVVGEGEAVLTASQAGDNNLWNPAASVSQTVKVEDNNTVLSISNMLGLKLYPNPNNGKFNIEALNSILEVKIYDISGRLISRDTFNSKSITVNLDRQKGIYNVVIVTDSGVSVEKIMIK